MDHSNTPDTGTPVTDELLANNAAHAADFTDADLPAAPTRRLVVIACMDARLDPYALLGLRNGEAHILRNGGGVVTDDVIRSLTMSQRLLGTREVILLHHTDCGLQKVDAVAFVGELEAETGLKPAWALETFDDPGRDVQQSIRRLKHSPFLPHRDRIRGFVYDVSDGRLHEVDERDEPPGADAPR